jgi:hypothetical protein
VNVVVAAALVAGLATPASAAAEPTCLPVNRTDPVELCVELVPAGDGSYSAHGWFVPVPPDGVPGSLVATLVGYHEGLPRPVVLARATSTGTGRLEAKTENARSESGSYDACAEGATDVSAKLYEVCVR